MRRSPDRLIFMMRIFILVRRYLYMGAVPSRRNPSGHWKYYNSVPKQTQIARFMGPTLGPTWVLSAPDGPHVGPMNLAIRDVSQTDFIDNIPTDALIFIMTSWHETLSELLAICVGNPPVTVGFPLQRHTNMERWLVIGVSITSSWTNGQIAGDSKRNDVHMTSLQGAPYHANRYDNN